MALPPAPLLSETNDRSTGQLAAASSSRGSPLLLARKKSDDRGVCHLLCVPTEIQVCQTDDVSKLLCLLMRSLQKVTNLMRFQPLTPFSRAPMNFLHFEHQRLSVFFQGPRCFQPKPSQLATG